MTGLIQAIRFDKGKIHDFEMYKNGNFDLSEELEMNADYGTPPAGFQGIQKLHSKVNLPEKASKLKPLTNIQKKQNTKKASKKVPIEHTNRNCKIFKICSSRYRGKHKNYQDNWIIIVAIVNLKTCTKHFKFATP